MGRLALLLLTALLIIQPLLRTAHAGEKSKLNWLSLGQGLTEARKANKKILVDVYTDWCGWCKRMDSDTYANPRVEAYLAKNYVVVKLNAESSVKHVYNGKEYTEQEIAGGFGVTGYPTTLFLKPTGEAITAYPGYADARDFGIVLSYIAEDHYLDTKFEEYAEGKKQ
jgi:thioredoxin-related protein